MTEMTIVTKALGDLRNHLKDTEDVRIDREERADKAQIKRDKLVEENCRADRVAVEKTRKRDLAAAVKQDKLTKKDAEAAQTQTDTVLISLLTAQAQ